MANHRARREAAETINEFADDHLIRTTDLLTEEKVAIESIRTAVDALNKGYTLLDSSAIYDFRNTRVAHQERTSLTRRRPSKTWSAGSQD
jgi:hypothetical protein